MSPRDAETAFRQLALDAVRDERYASVAWGVSVDGTLVHAGGEGELHDGRTPDARTVYRIASMTKSFTSAAVLALRDQGLWSLDDPVTRHAPELAGVRAPEGSGPITLRHLLSMTAGMATDDAWADRHLDISADEIDRIYAAGPTFAHVTNTAFEYSNLGFGMIGRAVRNATGRPVQEHITERFLQPLGLHDTTWVQPAHDRWARPTRLEDGAIIDDGTAPLGDGEISPMGGLWSTVVDLSTWAAWFDAAFTRPHQPDAIGLSPASRREMQRMHTYMGMITLTGRTFPAGYGFGLNVRDDATLGKLVGHSGGLPGYGSNMLWASGRGVAAVALANTTYARMSALTTRLLVAAHEHGLVPTVPVPVSPALAAGARGLVALLNAWDDTAATALFADNVALDESLARRAAAAQHLVDAHGPLTLVEVHAESLTRGRVEVRGSSDTFSIDLDLAPLPGAPVQYYEVTPPA